MKNNEKEALGQVINDYIRDRLRSGHRQSANYAHSLITLGWQARAEYEKGDAGICGCGHEKVFRPRFETVSEPGAAINVTRINLTDEEREELSINTRLSDLGSVQPAEDADGLRNCPFCGSTAKLSEMWKDHCGCSRKECGAYQANLPIYEWNTRASQPPQGGEE